MTVETGRGTSGRWLRIVLMCAALGLFVAALLMDRPVRDTHDDLQREADAIHVDYLRVDSGLLADIDDPGTWDSWIDCGRVEREAKLLLQEMRSQFGVLAFSARLNSAVSDGCDFDGAGLGLADILDRFDSVPPSRRWPVFARVFMRDSAHDADALREALVVSRAKSECAGKVMGRLRSLDARPDRTRQPEFVRHCWQGDREPA